MANKVLHLIWLGDRPIRAPFMDSYKKYLTDFEIKVWNEKNIPEEFTKCKYYQEMLKQRHFDLASDYIRFKLLYEYGGMYMDTDVEVIRNFDEIIEKGTFFGNEKLTNRVATGIIMYVEEPHSKIMKDILDRYEASNGHFPLIDGEELAKSLEHNTEYRRQPDVIQHLRDGITIYDSSYFCPMDLFLHMRLMPNTATIHHYELN